MAYVSARTEAMNFEIRPDESFQRLTRAERPTHRHARACPRAQPRSCRHARRHACDTRSARPKQPRLLSVPRMSAAAGGEELSTLTNLTKNLEEQLKKAEIQHQKQQHESKETLERFMAGMADMWEQNKGRSTPMAVEDKSESTDDEGTQSNKTIVLLA